MVGGDRGGCGVGGQVRVGEPVFLGCPVQSMPGEQGQQADRRAERGFGFGWLPSRPAASPQRSAARIRTEAGAGRALEFLRDLERRGYLHLMRGSGRSSV